MGSEATMKMKLLIDKKKTKVVYGEANKECVDFLLNFLSLPLATVVENLTKTSMDVGSLGTLYGSFENLNTNFLQEGLNKECLLKPSSVPPPCVNPGPKIFYTCNQVTYFGYNNNASRHLYFSDVGGAVCPACRLPMDQPMSYVPNHAAVKTKVKSTLVGYVKDYVTYMIGDDLSVEPMSTISSVASSIEILKRFKVQDVSCLEEKEVFIDLNKGMALLKASMKSKTVLTDVFLGSQSGSPETVRTNVFPGPKSGPPFMVNSGSPSIFSSPSMFNSSGFGTTSPYPSGLS